MLGVSPILWAAQWYGHREEEGAMRELIHVSRIRIEKDKGPVRRAYIEAFPEPVRYGVHGGIKKFYGVDPVEGLPTTLDHMIAAVAG
jgi:hypothetical protein